MRLKKAHPLFIVVLLLASCARPPDLPLPAIRPTPPATLPDRCTPPDAETNRRIFGFDAAQSELHIHTFRTGSLARLGHNHIISAGELWGYLNASESVKGSRFVLCIPVARLIVDDPHLRAAAGEAFSSELDQKAIRSTRTNMLGERLLDSAHHPYLVIAGEALAEDLASLPMQITFAVRGHRHTVKTQAKATMNSGEITAVGELRIRQSDLGLKPYSALFGALQVRDELEIRYSLSAKPPR